MRVLVPVACAAALLVFAAGAAAQGKGGGGPKVKAGGAVARGGHTSHAPAVKTTTVKSAPVQKSHPTGHTRPADTAKATGRTTTAANRSKSTTTRDSHKSTTAATTGTTSTGGTGTTLTPVQQKLQRNTSLATKLESRLPAGTDLNAAAAGFRNLGQFVAAVNVSNNHALDFATLKTAMVVDGKSLGQAIQAQKTTVDGTTVAVRAERDADALIKSTESSTQTRKPKTKTQGRP
jgi:hypothetical protein